MKFQHRLATFSVLLCLLFMLVIVYENNRRYRSKDVVTASFYQRNVWFGEEVPKEEDAVAIYRNRIKGYQKDDLRKFVKELTEHKIESSFRNLQLKNSFNSTEFKKRFKYFDDIIIAFQLRQDNFQREFEKEQHKSLKITKKHQEENEELKMKIKKLTKQLEDLKLQGNKIQEHQNLTIEHRGLTSKKLLSKKKHQAEIENPEMLSIHQRVYFKFMKQEIKNYYEKERISQKKFGERILDIDRDRKILKDLFPGPNEQDDRITDQLRVKLNVTKTKTIFVRGFDVNTQEKFENDKCNVDQCRITTSMGDVWTADAIYSEQTLSPLLYMHRRQQDVLVFFQIEGASNYPLIGVDLLNWTATYRRDSVLNTPYERFVPYMNITDLPASPKRNFASKKSKKVVWFVSNCASGNNRLEYVRNLQKYIQVDIYGQCGQLQCPKNDKKCFEMLNKDYKFYLSFENTNCRDYITEKFFQNGLRNDILPIVMGAHPDDYKRIAPPNSYIHIDEFQSPKKLAEYLNFLDNNDDYYNQYFLWKDTGSFINTKFMCRLCTMVHLAPHFPMWYSDSNRWWFDTDTCVNPMHRDGIMYASWRGIHRTDISSQYVKYGYNRAS